MSRTCVVGILPSNCNGKNAKTGFQAMTCDFGTSEILCHYLYVTLCAGSCTKLSVQLRLIFDYCC